MKKSIFVLIICLLCLFITNVKAEGFLSEMPNNSYIIGDSLYTRSSFGSYTGILRTEYIMKGARTINSDDISSMKIYYKTPRGVLVNGLTGEEVDVYETDLMKEIKYYNGVEIPTLSLEYSQTVVSDRTNYTLRLNEMADNQALVNFIDFDLYGVRNWDGVIYNFPGGVTPGDNSEGALVLQDAAVRRNYGDNYDVTYYNGDYFTYVAYPYIENYDDKLYLNVPDSVTIYAGAVVNTSIVNNKMQISVSGISNYKIISAALYASEPSSENKAHIDMNDLIEASITCEQLRPYIDDNYMLLFNEFKKVKSNAEVYYNNPSYKWYIADMYSVMSAENGSSTIEMGDLGNSEKTEHDYYVVLEISSPDILNGKTISLSSISSPVHGTIYQNMPSDLNNLTSYNFAVFVALGASLLNLGN